MKYLQFLGSITRIISKSQVFINQKAIQRCWKDKSTLLSCRNDFNQTLLVHRNFCQESKPRKLNLMRFPLIVWPSIIKTIKNWIYIWLIIKPRWDLEFNLSEFAEGSKLAAIVVSNHLASGNLSGLKGLVTADCLEELEKNISVLNVKQRQELALSQGDIYFSFPYEIGVLFEDDTNSDAIQKRCVEITMVHHVLRGNKEMFEKGEPIPLNVGVLPEFREKLFILNYRYIRNYTEGVSDQWTLNIVNHFKPSEIETN